MRINICIGSSCHLKGSRRVVEELQRLIQENALTDQVELNGVYCLGRCQGGVSVNIEGRELSVSPESVTSFFEKEILAYCR